MMRKEGHSDVIETILYVNEFRQTFGSLLIAKTSGGRAFLTEELIGKRSILSEILQYSKSKAKLDVKTLKAAENYLP